MHPAYSKIILALALCTVPVVVPIQKGPQSLVNLAMAAYVKKILTLETIPSQEELDKLMPKDLHPLIAQMLMKPVIEYIRDEKFRSPQIKSCKLPQKYKETDFDDKGHLALLTDKEDKVYLVDIIKSMEPSPESDGGIHIIASFDNQKIADLSRNGKFFAGVGMDNVVTVYQLPLFAPSMIFWNTGLSSRSMFPSLYEQFETIRSIIRRFCSATRDLKSSAALLESSRITHAFSR
jgi:hypothetical protein